MLIISVLKSYQDFSYCRIALFSVINSVEGNALQNYYVTVIQKNQTLSSDWGIQDICNRIFGNIITFTKYSDTWLGSYGSGVKPACMAAAAINLWITVSHTKAPDNGSVPSKKSQLSNPLIHLDVNVIGRSNIPRL